MGSLFKKRGGRKSQVTLFIILGIVLIFSTAIIIFIKSQAREEMPSLPEVTEILPVEIQPVRDYIEECIYITAKEAVEMIGVHGGYIGLMPEDMQYTSKAFDVDIAGMDPTSHDTLAVSKEWHIPYWNHMTSANTCGAFCEFGSLRPPLLKTQGSSSIENQIDRYIEINIDECLADFVDFEEEGFLFEKKDNISVRTIITDENVIIFAEYPIEVSLEDTSVLMTQYITNLDVNLKKIYALASEITVLSVENKFMEMFALNLIAGFSGIDEDALPPMAGVEFEFMSKRWVKSEVVRKLQDILAIYINLLQATRTENFKLNYFPENEIKTGLYAQMVLPLDDNYYDTSVDFNYLGWPIYFYISPGELITAREGVAVPIASLFIPFQKYDLPYDVSFPVMVELRDKEAFFGNGYSFFFALEANIRNNEPVTEDFVSFQQQSDVTAQAQLCNENQRTSGDVTIATTDMQNNPLDGAMIYFSVGDLMCPIGQTTLDGEGNIAAYTGKFPIGAIGTLIVMHPDTAPYYKEFFRAEETPERLDAIKMMKYASKTATAVKMDINKFDGEWMLDPEPIALDENDEVIIMLEKVKENPVEPDVMAAVSVKSNKKEEIRLVPGKYKATITLLRDKTTIIIPPQKIQGQEIPEMKLVEDAVFPTVYEVFIIFDNSIYSANEIIFKAINFNLVAVPEAQRTFDDLGALANVTQYASQGINYLSPILS